VNTPHTPGTEQVFTTNTIILRYTQKNLCMWITTQDGAHPTMDC